MLLRTGSAFVAGVLLSLAFEPVGASFLIPFAVAGFVLTTRGLPARRGWIPGLAFGIGFCYVLMFWMRVVGVDAWLALSALEASFYAILGAVAAALSRLRFAPVWIACAWVGMEAVRSTWPFGGMPWGRLAFATAETPWQEALPYVGQSGLGLLLALLGCLLAWAVVTRGRTRVVSAVAAVVVLGAGMATALTPYDVPTDGQRSVAVVQGNVPGDGDDILLDHRQVTRNHVDATIALADDVAAGDEAEPDFVLWPENSTAVDPFADAGINAAIREASEAVSRPILVGAMVDSGAGARPQPGHRLGAGRPGRATGTPNGTRSRSASTSPGAASSAATAQEHRDPEQQRGARAAVHDSTIRRLRRRKWRSDPSHAPAGRRPRPAQTRPTAAASQRCP